MGYLSDEIKKRGERVAVIIWERVLLVR